MPDFPIAQVNLRTPLEFATGGASDGIFYTSEVTTGAANTYVEIVSEPYNLPADSNVIDANLKVDLNLVVFLKSVSAGTTMKYRWQYKVGSGAWVDIYESAAVTPTTTGTEYPYIARIKPGGRNLTIHCEIQANVLNDGKGNVKSTSWVM